MFQNSSLHPMTLPPVIQKVMDHLSNRDLQTCRLVSKEWNADACARLRQTKTLKFRIQSKLLEDFCEDMKESRDSPYANFELEFYNMEDPIVDNFIDICGKSIMSLQLNNCQCRESKLWTILSQLYTTLRTFSINCDPIEMNEKNNQSTNHLHHSPSLPLLSNLKSLSLFGEYCQNGDLIHDLILASPQLTSLHFKCFDPLAQESSFETLCLHVFLRHSIHLPKLRTFKMESRICDHDLYRLTSKTSFKLEYVHLNLKADVRPHTLLTFLQSLSSGLVKLELQFPLDENDKIAIKPEDNDKEHNVEEDEADDNPHQDQPPIPSKKQKIGKNNVETNVVEYYGLPPMGILQRLSLTNFQGSLAFLNNSDKLKYLFLINCDASLPTLTSVQRHLSLTCFMSTTLLDGSTCRQLAKTFPKLKTLKVNVDDEVLRTLFEVMTDLHELILSGQGLTDQGITGMSFDGCDDVMTPNQHPHLPGSPYIGNLKQLRKLWIHNAGFITDVSVLHGILACLNLTEISLLNAEVTDTTLIAIGNRLQNLKKLEILSNIPQLTAVGKAYIRQQLPECDFILGQMDIMNLYRPQRPPEIDNIICSTPMEILLGLFC